MNRQSLHTGKRLLRACMPFLVLSFSMPAAAATTAGTTPEPGSNCPDTDVLLVAAEELTPSLELTMRSRAALTNNDPAAALDALTLARTALHLAASRGAAARTSLLVDAVIQAKASEDYARMLGWFPLLRASLLTLPGDATESAAEDLIDGAEEIMQGDREGDPVAQLKAARHMLACDGLDIPLQAAIRAQESLMKQLDQGNPDKNSSYAALLDALRSATLFALGKE